MYKFVKDKPKEDKEREPHPDLEANRLDAIAFHKFWNPKCKGKRVAKIGGTAFEMDTIHVLDECLEICFHKPYYDSYASFVHRIYYDQCRAGFRSEATAALRAAGILEPKAPPMNQRMKDLFG